MTWNLSRVTSALGRFSATPLRKAGRHVDGRPADRGGIAAAPLQIVGELLDRAGLASLGEEHHAPALAVGDRGHVVVPLGAGSLVNGHVAQFGEVVPVDRQLDVALADRVHPMPRHPGQPGHRSEGHVSAHGQNQGFEQQREAGQSARPGRSHQRHPLVGESHTGHSRLEQALVLEEVEVPIALDLRVVHRMRTAVPLVGESAALPEVDPYRQPTLPLTEVHAVNEPRRRHAQRSREQFPLHLSSSFSRNRRDESCSFRSPATTAATRNRRERPPHRTACALAATGLPQIPQPDGGGYGGGGRYPKTPSASATRPRPTHSQLERGRNPLSSSRLARLSIRAS